MKARGFFSILTGVAMILALGVVLTIQLGGQEEVSAATLTQRAESQANVLLDELRPGDVLHIRWEHYKRHGPKAALIQSFPEAFPERFTSDLWIEAGENNTGTKQHTIVRDSEGVIIQESFVLDGLFVTRFPRISQQESEPSSGITSPALVLNSAGKLIGSLGTRQYANTGRSQLGETDAVVLELSTPYSESDLGTGSFRIPTTFDLNPSQKIQRVEIVETNPLIYRSTTWVVDANGSKTLVSETKVTEVEVLSANQLPTGVFSPYSE